MKKYFIGAPYLIFLGLLLPLISSAQDIGIKFESGLSWQEIQTKAKSENKLIFMDCFATWCGPCKNMEHDIYPQKEVGDYFNNHFISVKVQLDKTTKDSLETRAWYATADSLRKLYRVNTYPTFLFFSSNGSPLHKLVGAANTGADFINQASAALDSQRQYFTLIEGWKSHPADSAFLLHAILAAQAVQDNENAHTIVNAYTGCLNNPITKSSIDLIDPYILSESDKGFDLYMKNAAGIDSLYHNDIAEQTLAKVIFNTEVAPLFNDKTTAISWQTISSGLAQKYKYLNMGKVKTNIENQFKGAISREINESLKKQPDEIAKLQADLKTRFPGYDCGSTLLFDEAVYYFNNKSWDLAANTTISLIDHYGNQMSPETINELTWRCIFLNISDQAILAKGLKYMETVIKQTPEDANSMDTYANLLYKLGKKQEGVKIEEYLAQKSPNDSDFTLTLTKMKKGEPTWGDNANP
jgi:thioredoxin-related protein